MYAKDRQTLRTAGAILRAHALDLEQDLQSMTITTVNELLTYLDMEKEARQANEAAAHIEAILDKEQVNIDS